MEENLNTVTTLLLTGYNKRSKIEYMPAPTHFYDEFFEDIVGVSHLKDAKKEHIIIRARLLYIDKLMDTKPLHKSHTSVKPFAQHEDGEYAEFSIDAEPDHEFYSRVLQMEAGLEIVSPVSVRNEIAKRVHGLSNLRSKSE